MSRQAGDHIEEHPADQAEEQVECFPQHSCYTIAMIQHPLQIQTDSYITFRTLFSCNISIFNRQRYLVSTSTFKISVQPMFIHELYTAR